MKLPAKLIALAAAALLQGCASGPAVRPSASLSLKPRDWNITWSAGVPAHPRAAPDGAWAFDFPEQPAHVNYVIAPYSPAKPPSHAITITWRIMGDGVFGFNANGCADAPHFQFMLERQGDSMSADEEFSRLWNDERFPLEPTAERTVTIPLTSDHWSGVFGKRDEAQLRYTLAHLGSVGITLGGGCYAGHGVFLLSGAAQFVLVDFSVN